MSGPKHYQKDLKGQLDEALHRARELLRQSNSLLEEYRKAVERSHQLIDKSHEVLDRAKRIIRLNIKVWIIPLVPLFSELIPYGPY